MKGLFDESAIRVSCRSTNCLKWISGLVLVLFSILATIKYGIDYSQVELEPDLQDTGLLFEGGILPLRPPNYGTASSSAKKIFFDDDFKNKAIDVFSESIRIETESYDGMSDPKDDIDPWLKFYKFHHYLKKSFPLVHKHLKLEKPNKVSLLYTWVGSNPSLKPLLLTAHQDVVPVDPLSAGEWVHPPYSGHYDGKYIWGRGTIDCKNLVVGLLQSVETLITDGFKPKRTVILAFGSDEEIDGNFGAAYISKILLEKYGPNSFYALVDEGSAIVSIDDKWYATPATTEKGHVAINIKLITPGGHSSVPPDHTSIGIVAKLITLIEDDPFEPILSSKNPYLKMLQEVAKHSERLPKNIKRDILRAHVDPKANKRVIDYIVQTPSDRYLIQTSQAVDIIHGGVKLNSLPEFVEIVLDSRISVDQSVDDVVDHILKHIENIAEEFNLGIKVEDDIIKPVTSKGYFTVTYKGANALRISPDHGDVWDVFAGTIKHVWDDIVFSKTKESIAIAPSLLGANTDTKHYLDLTPNIYRFFPTRVGSIDSLGIHSINERIGIENHLETVLFAYEFIQNVDAVGD